MELIFVPGLVCTDQVWGKLNKLRDQYVSHDYFDFHGDSICEYADDIINKLVDVNKEYCLIGISMGGYIALDIAHRAPSWLKKLVLINTTFDSVDMSTIPDRQRSIKIAREGTLEDLMALSTGFSFFDKQKNYIDLELDMLASVGLETYARQQNAIINRRSYVSELGNIQASTLIISSREDPVLPYKDSIEMFEKIKQSKLHLLTQCGHLPTIEKTDETYKVVSGFMHDL